MALLDGGRSLRDILPPIKHHDFEKPRLEEGDPPRFSIMPNLSISTAPLASPTTMHSGPPPPYSCAPSTTDSVQAFSGYFSPPLSSPRRLTRDEKDMSSARTLPSLPSLHEALGGDKTIPLSGPPSATQLTAPGSALQSALGQTFPDATRGPPNPFAHSTAPPPLATGTLHNEQLPSKPNVGSETAPYMSHSYSTSPQVPNTAHRSSVGSFSSTSRPFETLGPAPPFSMDSTAQHTQPREYSALPPSSQPSTSTGFNFAPSLKFDDSRNPFLGSNPHASYGATVKRHLETFDAELALNEVAEGASRTTDFSRSWAQRHHQSNRRLPISDTAPSIVEIEEMMRQQQRILENLGRIRDFVIAEQTALSEERARAARTHMDDDYQRGLNDEYKVGGFAGGDAKKRRGKAAPPGRCHSCNRAETPEWRRGPDGARTLCNACGLHYAKLSRKMGVNKASTQPSSSLRPK